MSLKQAIFLDRDGTINVEKNYLYKIEDWQWIEGAPQAIKNLRDAGYVIIVVSNQSGIARGFYKNEDVKKLHDFVNSELEKVGTKIDAFYICPHHPELSGDCDCRKPKAGMILRAANEYSIDIEKSWLIGDKTIDIEASITAGAKPIMVMTGHGNSQNKTMINKNIIVNDIKEACAIILNSKNI